MKQIILKFILLFLILVFIIPNALGFLILVGTDFLKGVEPDWAIDLQSILILFEQKVWKIIFVVSEILPALIGAITFKDPDDRGFDLMVFISIGVLLIGFVLSGILLSVIDPVSAKDALYEGEKAVNVIVDSANSILRTSMIYACLIVGLNIEKK